jgi:hypothetical protein
LTRSAFGWTKDQPSDSFDIEICRGLRKAATAHDSLGAFRAAEICVEHSHVYKTSANCTYRLSSTTQHSVLNFCEAARIENPAIVRCQNF